MHMLILTFKLTVPIRDLSISTPMLTQACFAYPMIAVGLFLCFIELVSVKRWMFREASRYTVREASRYTVWGV